MGLWTIAHEAHDRFLRDWRRASSRGEPSAEMAQTALDHLGQSGPVSWASVALFDDQNETVELVCVWSLCSDAPAVGWRAPLGSVWFLARLAGDAFYACEDVRALAEHSPWLAALQREGIRAFVALPIVARDRLLGALAVGLSVCCSLEEDDRALLSDVAEHLALTHQLERQQQALDSYASDLERLVVRRTAPLRAASARLRTLFEQAPIGIALVRRDGTLETVSPMMALLSGYQMAELVEMSLRDLVEPACRDQVGARLEALFEGTMDRSRLEQRYLCKDGRMIWVNTTLSPVRTTSGMTSFALLMVEDTTQDRRNREALIESENLATMGRMAAALVHEINNPLQVVLGCLGLAEESAAEGQDVTRYLQVAHEELGRAAEIVGRLRDMQRRTDPAEKAPNDLSALMQNVLTVTEPRCLDQGIEVIWCPPVGLGLIAVAPNRVTQVYLNLVINALDAMPEGGCLQVEMAETPDPPGIRTTISDTGEGMDPERLSRPFEPFTSTKARGLGLGLYISRNIVVEHGGTIEAFSKPDGGTRFVIWLPAQHADDAAA